MDLLKAYFKLAEFVTNHLFSMVGFVLFVGAAFVGDTGYMLAGFMAILLEGPMKIWVDQQLKKTGEGKP